MLSQHLLFPFSEYWWFYGIFTLFVLAVLALDLGVFHRKTHAIGFKEALGWSIFWAILALCFNYVLYRYALWDFQSDARTGFVFEGGAEGAAKDVALQFLTGYIVEKSLAIDNIFVFVVIFTFLGVPALYQHRVLFYGIIGALIFRAVFIGLGSVLLQYEAIVIIFGVFLLLTGIKILFAPEKKADLNKHWGYRAIKKIFPVSSESHGPKFFVREGAKWVATPLFVALMLVEISDIIFAVDSVPAIFAITKEPMIVYTSNIFAILGMRSLYFLLAGSVDRFHLLKYGLGFVLIFVGAKMVWLNELYGGKFPITWSLAIIVGLIGGSILLSFLRPVRTEKRK